MKKLPIKIEKFNIKPDDIVVFTLGDAKYSIVPTKQDLKNWKRIIGKAFPNIKKQNWILTPAVLKTKVFGKEKKHRVYLDNLEYLEYLYEKESP